MLVGDFDDVKRIESDAVALLARENPSEETRGEFRTDRKLGWLSLLWDIPTTTILPFMTLNAWPRALRIPFHAAGSILYLGVDVNFRSLRLAVLWTSLGALMVVEILRHSVRSSISRFRSVLSRLLFGGAYTCVIYQSGALLGDYKSCEEGWGSIQSAPCKQTLVAKANVTQNSTLVRVQEIDLDVLTILLATMTAICVFRGAIQWLLLEKNASNPVFMWLPAYEAVRYTIKSAMAGYGSMFKASPHITLPVYFVGFVVMLVLTIRYQPCLGQGRAANNLRTTGFSLGAWFSFCGLLCLAFDADSFVGTWEGILVSYVILLVGGAVVVYFFVSINDKNAREFSLPKAPWHELLNREKHSRYVCKVCAHATLLHAKKTGGKAALDMRMTTAMTNLIERTGSEYIRIRLAAAYLIYTSAQANEVANVESEEETGTWSRGMRHKLSSTKASGKWKVLGSLRNMLRSKSGKSEMKGKREKRKTESGRLVCIGEGTFKRVDVNKCKRIAVDAILSAETIPKLKVLVSYGLVHAALAQDGRSYFSLDLHAPRTAHALCIAHALLLVSKTSSIENQDRDLDLKNLAGLRNLLSQLTKKVSKGDDIEFLEYFCVNDPDADGWILKESSLKCSVNPVRIAMAAIRSWFDHSGFAASRVFRSNAPPGGTEDVFNCVCPSKYVETILDALDHAWSLFYTPIEALGLCVLPHNWKCCIDCIFPLAFSTNLRHSTASLRLLSRIRSDLNAGWETMGGSEKEFGEMLEKVENAKKSIGEYVKKIVMKADDNTAIALHFYSETSTLFQEFSSKAWALLAIRHLGIFMFSVIHANSLSGNPTLCWKVVKSYDTHILKKAVLSSTSISMQTNLFSKVDCRANFLS